MLPAEQPNSSWYGATQLYVEIPSLGLWNSFQGQVELTGLPLGRWTTVSFTLSDDVLLKLGRTYTDLTFIIALNVPWNATGMYRLDNLRMEPETCATVNLVASKSYSPPGSVDGSQTFSTPLSYRIPVIVPTTQGSAGNGTVTLSLQQAGAPPTCIQRCTYKGMATQSHPVAPDQIALGAIYALQSCDSPITPDLLVSVVKVSLHVNQGDALSGTTEVQHIAPCATENLSHITPVPPGSDLVREIGDPAPGPTPETPLPTWPDEPSLPEPYLSPTSPEVNGVYVPVANPELQPIDLSL
jgi:hypothetical protein